MDRDGSAAASRALAREAADVLGVILEPGAAAARAGAAVIAA
ncbi:hypothetical protein [Nonomuraea sp. NPDC005692]